MAAQVQALLRFLSQDAKMPLADAMGKVIELQKAGLTSPEQISKSDIETLEEIFKNAKVARQVLNAAKRVSKKRDAPVENTGPPQKKPKSSTQRDSSTPFEIECTLSLPATSATEDELSKVVILTNRAPLVLAFAVCVLKHTMPEQPVSSRLSLAQAVVSANSHSKAVSLGIESEKPADQEGWGDGQPVIKVLGREVKVLKRWDYNPREGKPAATDIPQQNEEIHGTSNDNLGQDSSDTPNGTPPLWGIDLEALRSTHRGATSRVSKANEPLPIHTPGAARSYLLKSFVEAPMESHPSPDSSKRKRASLVETEKETCLGNLLKSIDLVCRSWAPTLTKEELDRRAWAWYTHVRPPVQSGPAGWGEKGRVKLSDILALRRQP
ncbi:hypothetical protein ETB97_000054 [Aspergillus alliaceus]|uniref:Impact N-terminal domain-containing protein n=1 Tax=Petromyces alliaceus TaxID=209559 RepID=A0A8H6ED21_PETAA|nr:hypothetical protein ETB97_000054 [Aspergillus burnettii]